MIIGTIKLKILDDVFKIKLRSAFKIVGHIHNFPVFSRYSGKVNEI